MLDEFSGHIIYINVVVTVFACLIEELRVIPRQELDGMKGFEVFVIIFREEGAEFLTCQCIVFIKGTMILVTIQFDEVEFLTIGSPCDVGEITVCRVTCIQIDGLVCLWIEDAHIDLMRCLSCHGIRVGRGGGNAGFRIWCL